MIKIKTMFCEGFICNCALNCSYTYINFTLIIISIVKLLFEYHLTSIFISEEAFFHLRFNMFETDVLLNYNYNIHKMI